MINVDKIKVGDILICHIPEEELNQYNQHRNDKEANVVNIYHVLIDLSPVTILIVIIGDEEIAISPKTRHWYTKK